MGGGLTMGGWAHLQLGDGDPVRVPDDPDVLAVFEARGFKRVDPPNPPGVADTSQVVSEVDGHGVGWLHVVHDETGGAARIPNQPGVLDDYQTRGWTLAAEPKPKPKPAKKAASKTAEAVESAREKE